ncbi:uncharacterized protein LOC116957628 isoform X1 [Petromyzon marinus]|uniref:uncharacterized protein LOC116957628 isoform X1 n=2 Tax=Petromyzon marinus TaxID=7757 RepID=UPI003F6F64DA
MISQKTSRSALLLLVPGAGRGAVSPLLPPVPGSGFLSLRPMEAFVKRENEEERPPRAELRAEVTARGSDEAPIRIKEEDDRCPPTAAAAGAGGGTVGEDNPTVKEEDLHIIEVDFQTEGEVAQHLMVADGSSSSVAVVEPGGGSWLSPERRRVDSARVAEIEVVLEGDDDDEEADDDDDDATPRSRSTKTARKGFVGTFGLRAPPLHRSTLRGDLWAHQGNLQILPGGNLRTYQGDLRGRQGNLWGRQGNLRIHRGDLRIHEGDLRARWGDLRAPVSVPSHGRDAAGSRRSARIRRRRVVALPPRTLGRAHEVSGDERADGRFNDDAAASGGGGAAGAKEEVKKEAEERVVAPSTLRISDPEVALVFFLALVLRALLGAAEMRRRADRARTRRAAAADAAVAFRGGDGGGGGGGLDRLNEILGRRRASRRRILHYLFQRKRRASVWTHVRSSDWWEREASSFTDAQWLRSFGLSRDAFAGVCSALGPALQRRDTTFRLCVPVDKRVAMALWKLANGGGGGGGAGYKGAAQLFGVSVTTVWRCVQEFCSAVSQSPSAERLAQMTQGFHRR